MNVGIIGDGKHSKRIQTILKKFNINFVIFKPKKNKILDKKNFSKLFYTDAVFIISPNQTHFKYLNKFNGKKYIFCEKPPVTNLNHLNQLLSFDYKRIYFDFNFRFSKVSKILSESNKYNLGKLIHANICFSHGYGLMPKYGDSWRSLKKKNSLGILETLSIHWLDLVNYHFKIKKVIYMSKENNSKFGDSIDTIRIGLKLKKGFVSIFNSYCAPFTNNMDFIYENGLIKINNKEILIKSPAIKLNKYGNFIEPNTLFQMKYDIDSSYQKSLEDSVGYFLDKVKKNGNFKKLDFNKSITVNKIVI